MKGLDREALLAALVLAPATYSRNRFFQLYTDPEMRHVRRRAAQIRSIVRHLARVDPVARGELLGVRRATAHEGDERVELTYTVPSVGLRRTATLDPVEIALVRFALARVDERGPGADDPDRQRVEAALRRLAPALDVAAVPVEPAST